MKNKKTTIIITLSAVITNALGILFTFNKVIEKLATSKNLLAEHHHETYHWRFGDIAYRVTGEGHPIFLIHDLESGSSSVEWSSIIQKLSKTNTVYAVDLLGCGLSEHTGITYTNHIYTQLINDFIHDIIKQKTSVVATGKSASFLLESCGINENVFEELILINPDSIKAFRKAPSKRTKTACLILKLKIIGTFIYNKLNTKKCFEKRFEEDYFYDKEKIPEALVDYYYESAHLGGLFAKNLYVSQRGRYTNVNIVRSLKSINKNIHILASAELPDIRKTIKEYQYYNPAIEVEYMDYVRKLPQLEAPDEIVKYIRLYLYQL